MDDEIVSKLEGMLDQLEAQLWQEELDATTNRLEGKVQTPGGSWKYPDGKEVLTKRICIGPGNNLSYQYHLLRDEVWTVVSGNGVMVLNDKRFPVKAGDVLVISKQSKHSLLAETEMDIIEVQTGSELIEEDIVRLAFDWNEIIEICAV